MRFEGHVTLKPPGFDAPSFAHAIHKKREIISEDVFQMIFNIVFMTGILLPKLFWPTDWEKSLKFEAEGKNL